MSKLVGVWDFEGSVKWKIFLKELGVGIIRRNAASLTRPTVIIEFNGIQWTFKTKTSFKNSELTVTEGVQHDAS
jgi:hypothetical protein